jgi:hypothetical protein
MLSLAPQVRVFVCTQPTDMRNYAESGIMRSLREFDLAGGLTE